MPNRVFIVVFDGVQALDVTGPSEVFANARRPRAGDTARSAQDFSQAHGGGPYQVQLVSIGGGLRSTSSGIGVLTRELRRVRVRASDIVVVAGGPENAVIAAVGDLALRRWLQRAAKIVRRMASVCSGAFVLASAGLLDGKRATTHWQGCAQFAQAFPQIEVDANAIFVRDGKIWTSAGVTTGIDMALAMVEEDLGREAADALAAALVLYVRRPGFQSQFSAALVAQTRGSDTLGPALTWARAHLDEAGIASLAKRAGLSVRTLHRRCLDDLGTTPAKLIDKLRVEHARSLLSASKVSAKELAAECGFGNSVRMKRAFERELGMGPREYRLLHASAE